MSENLGEHVESLKRELKELQMTFIDGHHKLMTNYMVSLEGIKREIDALDAFVIKQGDGRCLAILRKKMSSYLSKSDTKTVVLDAGFDFDYDTDESLSSLHWDLINYCERRELLPDLLNALKSERPRVHWPEC